jgi:hypothetical protein
MKKLFQPAARFPLILGVAAVLALTAGIGVATGTIPTSNGTINACQAKINGFRYVRLLDNGESCHGAEKALSWNQKGPKGDTGPRGPAGSGGSGLGKLTPRSGGAIIPVGVGRVVANCNPGEQALSPGYNILGKTESVVVMSLLRDDTGVGYSADVQNRSDSPKGVTLTVLCTS